MKKLIAAVVFVPFAAAVGASETYRGLEQGNPDLGGQKFDVVTATQPSVGDSVDRYQGWADGNSDLFNRGETVTQSTDDPDLYRNFANNPDLHF